MKPEEFKGLIHEVLDERDSIDKETHHRDHRYVAHLIDLSEQSKKRREKIKTHVIGWAIVSGITGLVYAVGVTAKKLFSE